MRINGDYEAVIHMCQVFQYIREYTHGLGIVDKLHQYVAKCDDDIGWRVLFWNGAQQLLQLTVTSQRDIGCELILDQCRQIDHLK